MFIRSAVFLLLLWVPMGLLAQQGAVSYKVMENGKELLMPDSLQIQLNEPDAPVSRILLSWLYAEGYLSAELKAVTDTSAHIDRGCSYSLNEMQVRYTEEGDDTTIVVRPEIPYTRSGLTREIKKLLLPLEAKGYPFPSAEIEALTPDPASCSVQVSLLVRTGEKMQEADLVVTGLRSNDPAYVRRISGFEEDAVLSSDYLRYVRSNLTGSELFNEVSRGEILLKEGKPVVVFEVEERELNVFNGVLGYVPDATGSGQVVGDLELSLWNVLAQGNGFDLRYKRLRPETGQLNLGLRQEGFGTLPLGISAGFQFYQNDTTYQARNLMLEGSYGLRPGIKLIGNIDFQSTLSGDTDRLLNEPDGTKRTARLGFQYVGTDSYEVPTSGSTIRMMYGIAQKDLEEDSAAAFTQYSLEVTARHYISIFKQSVLAASLQGYLLDADRVTFHDLIRFGGANSFRGYAEEQFRASTMVWGDLEYRFLLDRKSYLFTFAAAGGYHRPRLDTEANDQFRTTETLYSAGFGLSYRTRIGRLKFSYAVSPEESLGNGKVHVGIRTEL